MTIRKGEAWGQPVERPAGLAVAASDAALARLIERDPNGAFTVAGGDITLPTSQTDVWTGLPYLSETEPMPVEAGGLGNKLAYHAAHVRTRNTHSYQLSNSERDEWEDVTTTDSPELLTTGTRVDTLPNMAEHGQSVVIRQYHPGPLTVISIDLQTSAGTS